jgi:CheY-like chemotaxis protein
VLEVLRLTPEANGFRCRNAADDFEALPELHESIPDIIISALSMPKMSGFELPSIIQRRFSWVSVIVNSAEPLNNWGCQCMLVSKTNIYTRRTDQHGSRARVGHAFTSKPFAQAPNSPLLLRLFACCFEQRLAVLLLLTDTLASYRPIVCGISHLQDYT